MASRRIDSESESKTRRPPPTSPQAGENRNISLAVKLAEQQLRDGSASSQVVTHYLKAASARDALEMKRLELENRLAEAKIEQIQSAQRLEELYEGAINAMREYRGDDVAEYEGESDGY